MSEMNEVITITSQMLILVPVVSLVVQVSKKLPSRISKRLKPCLPVLSLVVGVAIACVAGLSNPMIEGLLIGTISSSGYDVFKNLS